MKKTAAILLILVLLFNLGGYRLLISSLQTKADIKLETAIDNKEYDEAELMEIKLPLNMPYQEQHTEFERHYGEITIDGKAYTYVQRKIDGDVLILKCIANNEKQLLKQTAIDITKSNSGQSQDNNGKKQSTSLLKTFSGDYDNNIFTAISFYNRTGKTKASLYTSALSDVLIAKPHQPPKTV